jgi:Fic family protein
MRFPESAPTLSDLFADQELNDVVPRVLSAGVGPVVDGQYVHWDDIRQRPAPEGLSRRAWWLGIKLARSAIMRPLPLAATDGRSFTYCLPDEALEILHWLDQHTAGEIVVSETIKDAGDRRRYLVNSLFEEAITSSQLEGASATRQVAKEMLRTGRAPRDRGERMILNNYRAMTMLRDFVGRPLTPKDVLELHRVVTEYTLDDPSAAGRLQTPDEVRVVVTGGGEIAHIPPPAVELPGRLEAMCNFTNGESDQGFLHPVVRAILLHLWLGYDHPFVDGNGRTARALFYRTMLANGYWLFEYVTISRLLVKAPVQYGRSFLYTETDEFDATYFIVHQLRVIRQAIEELLNYIGRKIEELRETIQLLRRTDLNHRQIALLTHALRHGDAEYTYMSHATSHRVVRQSARTDLLDLESRGLLVRRPVGGKLYFHPVTDLRSKLSAA